MKKVRLLLIVNIIQIILLIGSIVAAVILLPNVMLFSNAEIPLTVILGTDVDKNSGFAQVTYYGAIPNDNKDDTKAFEEALKTNASIYVPIGTYDISKTLEIENKTLKGCGIKGTVIRSSAEDFAISLKGSCVAEEFTVSFADSALTGSEKSGERVAIYDNGLTNGSMIKSVAFKNIGTGFLSDKEEMGAFCTTIEGVTFENYSYKAVDIKSGLSSIIRSTTVFKGKSDKLIPVSLGGVVTVESLCFKETVCDYAIELKNSDSTVVRSLTFDKTKASSGSFIRCDSARFTLQTINLLDAEGNNILSLEDDKDAIVKSDGLVLTVYTNKEGITVCKDGKIQCDTILN